jgi:hypothetical protein
MMTRLLTKLRASFCLPATAAFGAHRLRSSLHWPWRLRQLRERAPAGPELIEVCLSKEQTALDLMSTVGDKTKKGNGLDVTG